MSKIHQLAGRVGGYAKSAKTIGVQARQEATAAARTAFLQRFAHEPDPEAARRLYMARLSLKRFQGRQRKRRAA